MITMKAPVGPPICTRLPLRSEMRNPATMAVYSPCSGVHARGDGKGDGKRQGDDADDDARGQVLEEYRAGISLLQDGDEFWFQS